MEGIHHILLVFVVAGKVLVDKMDELTAMKLGIEVKSFAGCRVIYGSIVQSFMPREVIILQFNTFLDYRSREK